MADQLGFKKTSVLRALAELIKNGVIKRDENGCLFLEKDYDKWLPGNELVVRQRTKSGPSADLSGPSADSYKGIIKEIKEKKEKQISEGGPYADHKKVKELTPIQMVIRGFKEAKGIDADDKDWDRKFFARNAKVAKEVLNAFDGNALNAVFYILKKGSEWSHLDDWGLEAIHRACGREYNKIRGLSDGSENGTVGADGVVFDGGYRLDSPQGETASDEVKRLIENALVHKEKTRNVAEHGEDFIFNDEDIP